MKRQKVRKTMLIITFLLFPVIIYYFSPYFIIQGALEGVINGSFCVFAAMLIGSAFFGRLFCGYLCPAGGIQECVMAVNDKVPKQGWRDRIKYVIWLVWIAGVIISFLFRRSQLKLDFFYQTDHGISISNIYGYIIYYGIVCLIFIPALIGGKRAFCHYFCWMAPFMVVGSRIGRGLHIKRLLLSGDNSLCVNCRQCDKKCPMGLRVSEKVQKNDMYDEECILCGECIDGCPKKAIKYAFKQ